MSKVDKIEDLIVWQKAKGLAVDIYKLTNEGSFSKDFGLRNQIRRAAVSISSNIAEGFGRGGNKEFLQFMSVARGSLFELKTQIIIAREINYLREENYQSLHERCEEIGRLSTGFMKYLSDSEIKGLKYNK